MNNTTCWESCRQGTNGSSRGYLGGARGKANAVALPFLALPLISFYLGHLRNADLVSMQDDTLRFDVRAAAVDQDGSVVLAGSWMVSFTTNFFAVRKLDSSGTFLWEYQVRSRPTIGRPRNRNQDGPILLLEGSHLHKHHVALFSRVQHECVPWLMLALPTRLVA